jgi:hypothetical protein
MSDRQRLAETEAREKVAAWRRSDAMVLAAQRNGAREAAALFKNQSRLAEQEARKRISLAQKVANEERRLRAELIRDPLKGKGSSPHSLGSRLALLDRAKGAAPHEQRAALDQLKDLRSEAHAHQANAQEKIRAMQRADREVNKAREAGARVAEKMARDELRLTEQTERQRNAIAMKWVHQTEAERRRADAAAQQRREQIARTVTSAGGTAVKNATSLVARTATGIVQGGRQVGGGFSLTDSVQRRLQLRGNLADIANRAILPGDPENSKRRSVDDLQKSVNTVGARWAIDPEQATAGLDKFAAKTGNLSRGLQLMNGLAEMSRAGAGSLDDLSDAAGDVFNADKTQSAEKVLAVMRALSAQGKLGAVEMRDLASQMAKLGAAASQFQGDSGKNLAMMGGLAQLARESGGAAGPQQATTAIQSLAAQLNKNARVGGFRDLGVEVKDEKGFNRPLDEILIGGMQGAEKRARSMKDEHGRSRGMQDFDVIFGNAIYDQQARRAILPLTKAYKAAGGGEEGTKAVRAQFQKYAGATQTEEEIRTAAAERMKEADTQLEIAMQKLRTTTADSLTPSLAALTSKLTELVPLVGRTLDGFVKLASWAETNPFSGFAGLVTAFFVAELGKAAIADTIKNIITGAAGGTPPPGSGAGGGAGGLVALGVGTQVAVASKYADQAYAAHKSGTAQGEALAKDVAAGGERGAAAQQMLDQLRGQSTTGRQGMAIGDYASRLATLAINPLAGVANLAGDAATRALGGKASTDVSDQTIKASSAVSSFDEAMAKMTASSEQVVKAFNQVAKAGESAADPGMANPAHPSRGPGGMGSPRRPER